MTWRQLIEEEMAEHGDSLADAAWVPHGHGWMDVEFDDDHGPTEGCCFTRWTTDRVYFPAVYDGREWAASVPRNPCDEVVEHVGGS